MIIVPAESGTNSSGPRSPTIEGLPLGGLPPFANPKNFSAPGIGNLDKARETPKSNKALLIFLNTFPAISPRDLVPSIAAFIPSTNPLFIVDPISFHRANCHSFAAFASMSATTPSIFN